MRIKTILSTVFLVFYFFLSNVLSQTKPELVIQTEQSEILNGVEFSPDGKYVLTYHEGEKNKIWSTKTCKLLYTIEGQYPAIFSPDGRKISTRESLRVINIWDSATGKFLYRLEAFLRGTNEVFWSPDGRQILLSNYEETWYFDAESGEGLDVYYDATVDCSWSKNGKLVVILDYEGNVKIRDIETGDLLNRFSVYRWGINSATLSPNNKRLLTASRDKLIKIWDLENNDLVHAFDGHTDEVYSASWSPNGKRIASISADSTTKVWDAENGNLLYDLRNHTDVVNLANWSFDGNYLLTFSRDNTVKIWDVETGRLNLSIEGCTDSITSAAFSSDGKSIRLASDDNTIKFWDIETGNLIRSIDLGMFVMKGVNLNNKMILSFNTPWFKFNYLETGREIAQIIAFDSTDYFIKTPDNYYMATKNALAYLSFKFKNKLYSFKQFDLKYNRPDIVLERLGYHNKDRIEVYHEAYLNRLNKMGIKKSKLKKDRLLPQMVIDKFEYMPEIDLDGSD